MKTMFNGLIFLPPPRKYWKWWSKRWSKTYFFWSVVVGIYIPFLESFIWSAAMFHGLDDLVFQAVLPGYCQRFRPGVL